jgi:hypothetical protein
LSAIALTVLILACADLAGMAVFLASVLLVPVTALLLAWAVVFLRVLLALVMSVGHGDSLIELIKQGAA